MSSYFVRVDSSSANNPALNLTGAPSFEITFVPQTPTGGTGDLFLESGAQDTDTVVSIGGQTYSFTLYWTGFLPTQNSQGANQVPIGFRNDPVVRIGVNDYPAPGQIIYLTFLPYEQATSAQMDAFGTGAIRVQQLNTDPPPVPVCFAENTLILTADGECAVKDLRVGHLVVTVDAGLQPVRWIGSTRFDWPGADAAALPVCIRAGALGPGRPRRDLVVSPQHRLLIDGPAELSGSACPEFLAAAVHLLHWRGVRRMRGVRSIRYFHLLLDRHALVWAEGTPAESFFPGPMALRMLSLPDRIAVMALFPDLARDPEGGYGPLCRQQVRNGGLQRRVFA